MQDILKEAYKRALQTIKDLNIENEKQYRRVVDQYMLLNTTSLKFMTQKKNFSDIIEVTKEV